MPRLPNEAITERSEPLPSESEGVVSAREALREGEVASVDDSRHVNCMGEPDAGNLHVRFEEGPGLTAGATLLV